jgi:hypothetical protein
MSKSAKGSFEKEPGEFREEAGKYCGGSTSMAPAQKKTFYMWESAHVLG